MIIIVSRDESLIFSRKRYLTQAIALSKSLAIFRSVLKPLNMGVMSHMSTSESAIEYWLGDSSPFSNADSNWQKMLGPVVIGGDSHSTLSDQHESWFLITPYWMIAVPLALALMSGYLILSGFRTHPRTTQLNASLQSAAGRRPE